MKKNNKSGILIYHCRRCDNYIKMAQVPHLPSSVKSLCLAGETTDRWGREEFVCQPHTCPDGQIGVTDLIGGEYDEESDGLEIGDKEKSDAVEADAEKIIAKDKKE